MDESNLTAQGRNRSCQSVAALRCDDRSQLGHARHAESPATERRVGQGALMNRGARGFTLIEMVVALAVLGLLAGIVFESLRFGQSSYQRVVRRGAQSWEMFAGQRLVRGLLENAYPQQPIATSTTANHGLQGDIQSISIVARAPLAAGDAGLYKYEIALRRSAAGANDVVIRWHADLGGASQPVPSTSAEEVLIERVASMQWSYFDDGVWLDSWRGKQPLPKLVRLRIGFPAGDARRWPELIVSPRITDDANCAFDVVAQRCRSGAS